MRHRIISSALTVTLAAGTLSAQSLGRRIAESPDGKVTFSFAARPDVCGNGEGMIGTRGRRMWTSRHSFTISDDDEDDRSCPCDEGPVHVVLRVQDRRIVDLSTSVGPSLPRSARAAADLGVVPVAVATDYLLGLATGNGDSEIAKQAIFPATLADSVRVWPRLLTLARDSHVDREVRRSAVFWVGQAAEVAATRGLDSLAADERGDREVREQAVFALSQRPRDEGVPILIRIARTNRDPEIRKKALFWLGQSGDDRALALFEEILLRD